MLTSVLWYAIVTSTLTTGPFVLSPIFSCDIKFGINWKKWFSFDYYSYSTEEILILSCINIYKCVKIMVGQSGNLPLFSMRLEGLKNFQLKLIPSATELLRFKQ